MRSLVLLFLCAPLLASVPGEMPVSEPFHVPATGYSTPAIAGNGESFLVVAARAQGLLAARTTAAPAPLDVPALVLTHRDAESPAVTWTGTHYLVSWYETSDMLRLMVARVTADGQVLDFGGREIARSRLTGLTYDEISMATAGGRTLLMWAMYGRHQAFLLDSAGNLVRDVRVPVLSNYPRNGTVAGSPDGFLLVWTDSVGDKHPISGWRVSLAGEPLDSSPIRLADDGGLPAITTTPGGYFLVYGSFDRARLTNELRGVFLSRDGSSRSSVTLSTSLEQAWPIRVSANASHLAVGFSERQPGGSRTVVTLISFAGQVQPPFTPPGEYLPFNFRIAPAGDDFLIVWNSVDQSGSGFYGRRLSSGDKNLLLVSSAPQHQPALAPGVASAAIWIESRRSVDEPEVRFGWRRDGVPQSILLSQTSLYASPPKISFNGESYLAVWSRQVGWDFPVELVATRLSIDGRVLDHEPLVLTESRYGQFGHSVATDGSEWLVVFVSEGGSNRDLLGVRIGREGIRLDDQPRLLNSGTTSRTNIEAVFTSGTYVLIWEDLIVRGDVPCQITCPVFYQSDIYAMRVSVRAEPIDSVPIAIAIGPRNQSLPAIAARGDEVLVVWQSGDEYKDIRYAIRANRFLHDSGVAEVPAVLDGFAVSTSATDALHPAVTPWSGGYVIVWTEALTRDDSTLAGVLVSEDSANPLRLESAVGLHRFPALTTTAGGGVLLAYERSTTEPMFGGGTRVFLRELRLPSRRRAAAR